MKDRSKTKEEALAHFCAHALHLSNPAVQAAIEAEARRQIALEIQPVNELLARSSVLGRDEILR